MSSTAMQLDHVTFGYRPSEPVVRDVSVALAAGRVTALIGPNAAGKSTLLRLMLGHASPQRGRVLLGGKPVSDWAAAGRAARVSYVPQRPSGRVTFTVRQVAALGRTMVGRDDDAVRDALEACELTDIADRVFAELSVGQQQRVALARAMAQSRGAGEVMLLDEPVSAMDLRHQHATMRSLVALSRQGLAVVVVLHDLNLASAYADDVWLLHRGQLAAAGDHAAVLTRDVLEPVYEVTLAVHENDAGRRVFHLPAATTIEV